jgi:prolyl oligopeptidase
VRDVATGRDLPDEIARTRACSLAWFPDGKGFYYTRYPTAGSVPAGEEKYHRSVFRHRLGEDPARDETIFGAGRDLKDWPGVTLSPNGRWLVVQVNQGWSKAELYLLDVHAAGKPPAATPMVEGVEANFDVVEVLDDRIYIRSNQDAPRGRLFAADLRHPQRARWKQILPQQSEILETVTVLRGQIAAHYLESAISRVWFFSLDGKREREMAMPGVGSLASLSNERHGDELFLSFTSFLTPTMILRVHAGDAKGAAPAIPSVWRELTAPLDPDAFEVEQVRSTSRDGTHCPLFLVHKRGALVRDGSHPTLLYGYGGFNVNILPHWEPQVAPFLEHGGVYAVAILRGGGEYGEAWHQAGMLGHKQNVFDDFIGAAEWLIREKITAPAHLAISGRSNGGLLIGATITQRPELYRAAICGVPLLDMIRYHRFRIAQLWIPEYGSSEDPEQFKWLYAYSPYHHVKDGIAYPAVLIHTAESDTRVDPMHARKMTARLQAASTGGPVLLRLESKAGHGAGKPLGKVIDQLTDEWSFLFSQLGLVY